MQSDNENQPNSAIHAAPTTSTEENASNSTAENNAILDTIFQEDEAENVDPDIEDVPEEKRKGRKSGPKPEKTGNRLPRLAFGDLVKTRATLSRLTKKYARGELSDAEYRCLVYGMRALSQMHVSERIGRVEEDTRKIKDYFHKKGIDL